MAKRFTKAKPTSYRLSKTAIRYIEAIATHYNISRTAVVDMAVLEYHKKLLQPQSNVVYSA